MRGAKRRPPLGRATLTVDTTTVAATHRCRAETHPPRGLSRVLESYQGGRRMTTPGAPTARTPGYTERVRQIVSRATAAVWALPRLEFGFDVLDTIQYGFGAWGYDTIDVINEGRERDIPTRCTACNEAWLMGPEALAAGLCWRCRT
jgi:hypothetical protein